MIEDRDVSKTFDTVQSGLYIVTSAYRRSVAGCTVVWMSRASFNPPLVAVHLAPRRHTYSVIEQGKRFCVNVMGSSGVDLSRHFGFTSGHEIKKFENIQFEKSKGGSPILAAAVSYIDCKLDSIVACGDHHIVLGKVIDAAVLRDEEPALYDPQTFYPDESVRDLVSGQGAEG